MRALWSHRRSPSSCQIGRRVIATRLRACKREPSGRRVEPVGEELHHDEGVAAASRTPADAEAGTLEGALGARVPVERLQVDAAEARRFDDADDQRLHRVGAVAATPVVTLADRDTDFGFTAYGIDVVVHGVADVASVHVLDCEAVPVRARVRQLIAV